MARSVPAFFVSQVLWLIDHHRVGPEAVTVHRPLFLPSKNQPRIHHVACGSYPKALAGEIPKPPIKRLTIARKMKWALNLGKKGWIWETRRRWHVLLRAQQMWRVKGGGGWWLTHSTFTEPPARCRGLDTSRRWSRYQQYISEQNKDLCPCAIYILAGGAR